MYLTKLRAQLADLKKEFESLGAKKDAPTDKERGASLRVQIENLGQTISIWEGKDLHLKQRLAEWEKIEVPFERTEAQMDRIHAKLEALGVGNFGKALREELVGLENKMKKEEAELADYQKANNTDVLQIEGNKAAEKLSVLNRQLAAAKKENDLLGRAPDAATAKERGEALKIEIKKLEQSIKTGEREALALAHQVADFDLVQSRVERTKHQIDLIKRRLIAVTAVN